jgi:hypothetical protein
MLLPLLALLMLAPGPADAVAAGPCAVAGSETARATRKVRVYWSEDHLYGCVRSSGLTRHLYGSDYLIGNQYDQVRLIRIAGHHVAFATSSFCTVCGEPGPSAGLSEVELLSGVWRHLGPVRRYDRDETGVSVNALVLDRCGRVAYRAILSDSYAKDEDPDPELHTWVGDRRRRVDRGSIGRRSIRLEPKSVHWRRDGEPRSAPLSPAC